MNPPRLLTALSAACLLVLAGCGSSGDRNADEDFQLTILHINDHHSHLDPTRTSVLAATGADGARKAVPLSLGGFARVASAIEALAAGRSNLLKLHAGDAITGTLYFTLSQGEADAALMNTVCFDAFTIGNHEFDSGDLGLAAFLGHLGADPDCDTAVLSANVLPGASSPLQQAAIRPAVVVERAGERIGLVGLTVQDKTQRSSRPSPGTVLLDELETAQTAIDGLRAQGVDKIILLSHVGYQRDLELAGQLSGVDVIVGGDTHTLLGDESLEDFGLTPAGPYPTRRNNRDGDPVCVVQAWHYGYAVGELELRFDRAGRVTHCAGQPHILIGVEEDTLSAAELTALHADLARQPALRLTEPSARVETVLAPYRAAHAAFGQTVAGEVPRPLCLRRVPGPDRDPQGSRLPGCNTDPHVLRHGGDVQQIVAEAYLHQGRQYGGADISLQNGGGVREDILTGALTVDAIYALLPFPNTLVRLQLRSDEIHTVLEDAMDAVVRGSTGAYPYAGGLRWQVDLNRPRGERVGMLEVRDVHGQWSALQAGTTYRVITSDFLADGLGGYASLKNIESARREATYLAYADAFLQYVLVQGSLSRPASSEFSTQHFVDLQP